MCNSYWLVLDEDLIITTRYKESKKRARNIYYGAVDWEFEPNFTSTDRSLFESEVICQSK